MLVVFKQSHLLTGEITPRYPIISVILRKHWSWQTTHIKENQIVGNFRISNLQFGGGSREISASSRWILFIKKNGLTRSKLITQSIRGHQSIDISTFSWSKCFPQETKYVLDRSSKYTKTLKCTGSNKINPSQHF